VQGGALGGSALRLQGERALEALDPQTFELSDLHVNRSNGEGASFLGRGEYRADELLRDGELMHT